MLHYYALGIAITTKVKPNNQKQALRVPHPFKQSPSSLHPQTYLPTCRASHNPIPTAMKHSNRRDGRDQAFAAQLGELLAA